MNKPFIFQKFLKKNLGGFTLIEVIVAIFLITVGVGGSYAVIQRTTAFASVASSRLAAAYLAQEGIELVRNQRDSNWLAGNQWDGNLPGTETGLLGKFDRVIGFAKPQSDKIEVSVNVSWQERDRTHQIAVQENLYNWR